MSRAPSRASALLGKSSVSASRAPARSIPAAAAGSSAAAAGTPAAGAAASGRLRYHTAELEAVFRCIDRDRDGLVSLSDLALFLSETLQQKKSEKEVRALLDEIAGVGAPRSARDARSAVGLRLGEDGASQLLKSVGATGDSIDFTQFCSLVATSLPS
ncbi:hypothetical protein Esti_000714 [Eimeria stiedai]